MQYILINLIFHHGAMHQNQQNQHNQPKSNLFSNY